MLTFNKISLAALATPIAIFLGACASGVHSPKIAQPAARGAEPFPVLQSAMIMPLVTDLDTMRAALPAFSLRDPADREVSVERILGFPYDSPIVSSQDLKRLELLKIYLRNNPTVGVRVEGYFGPQQGAHNRLRSIQCETRWLTRPRSPRQGPQAARAKPTSS
jgi:hypothetical protein